MSKGVAPSTFKAYTSAWSSFLMFCYSFQIPLFPILVTTVCSFLVFNFENRNLKISSIRRLLAGIQFYAKYFNPDFPSLFTDSSVRLLLKGFAKSSTNSPDKRLPFSLPLLQRLILSLRNGLFSIYSNILLEAVFLTAFYGFMRPGEFTSASKRFDPVRGLCLSDLHFSPNFFTLFLKHSKNDSSGSGVSITISKISNNFCPFTSMIRFLKIRPRSSDHSPLFSLSNGAPLSKTWFRSHLVSVLKNCSLSPSLYTGHSFRIGAATTAAERGVPTTAIKILGRWSSSAFESYIRPDLKTILEAQQALQ
ncbi:uncharacterized protein LOC113099011 isoform X1 [Carassius auratus]|uniref:Uncharacterized protein LOC113099011 isoform X1 n=1 Tax=Carassius auratus TaxID=7957 RepID=A0A6P6PGQ6_CARAU|nr:uncharacterized protein LOC113099011 isoform X1 [Carassius auratus]XP_026119849.1 uncharacterized protein LOC113099011 isoform X1 [Carassius auratus]XP_052400947.1 uncharacterized protein LOC127948509 [Carassius gibelio]